MFWVYFKQPRGHIIRPPPFYQPRVSLDAPYLLVRRIFTVTSGNRRNLFLRRKSSNFLSFCDFSNRSCFSREFSPYFIFPHANLTQIMAEAREMIRMTHMLEVEELSFRIQLEEAVSEVTSFIDAPLSTPFCFLHP